MTRILFGFAPRLHLNNAAEWFAFCGAPAPIVVLTFLLAVVPLWSLQDETVAAPDSAGVELNIAPPDSTAARDSLANLPPAIPLKTHGALLPTRPDAPYRSIAKEQTLTTMYDDMAELLYQSLPVWPLDLGFAGQNNSLSFFGGDRRDIGLMFNGRELNDPAFGSAHLGQFSPEFMEQAQIFVGSNAMILHDQAMGAAINIQEIRYNTDVPYTRLWYSQGGDGLLVFDGVYSRNLSRDWTMNIGWRSLGGDGTYENFEVDAWNVRFLVRWNVTGSLNISLSDNFTNHQTDVNGGVDVFNTVAIGDPLSAGVLFNNLDERAVRHDVTLTSSLLLNEDSTSIAQLSAYASEGEWALAQRRFGEDDETRISRFATRRYGLNGFVDQNFGPAAITVGGDMEYLEAESGPFTGSAAESRLAGYGLLNFSPGEALNFGGGMRITLQDGQAYVNVGGRIGGRLSRRWKLMADLSRGVRRPTPAEDATLDAEQHLLALLQAEWSDGSFSARLSGFFRRVDSPIEASYLLDADERITGVEHFNLESEQIAGVHAVGAMNLFGFSIEPFALLELSRTDGTSDAHFPAVYGGVSIEREFVFGRSRVKVGARTRGLTGFEGQRFDPLTWSDVPSPVESNPNSAGIDIYGYAYLGNAVVKAMFQNALGQTWYYVPVYPQQEMAFRLGVTWAFFD